MARVKRETKSFLSPLVDFGQVREHPQLLLLPVVAVSILLLFSFFVPRKTTSLVL